MRRDSPAGGGASDHLQQPATAVVVLRVGPEVVGQVVDFLGEERDLDLRRAGVVLVRAVLRRRSVFSRMPCCIFSARPAPRCANRLKHSNLLDRRSPVKAPL